jgi:hypothetical protein
LLPLFGVGVYTNIFIFIFFSLKKAMVLSRVYIKLR